MANSDDVLLTLSTRLESIDNSLQAMVALLERVDSRLERIDDRLETNVDQIGAFMEGLTRLENTVNTGFERLEAR